ncbi:MAG: hypothetical protein IJO45_06280 [Oscillospiraceae bacterium]|nr:hypothetical protein [Oscillospiraceae bacterium]
MGKRLFCYFLCLLFLLTVPFCVLATEEETLPPEPQVTEISISTPEEFLAFAENCRLDSYSEHLAVTLTADLELTGTDFSGVPIFCGSFDGAGHTISYSVTKDGSVQGLFRYLTSTAVIRDLHLKAALHPGGSRSMIGALAGENAGVIRNCSVSGNVQGGDSVGGIAGVNTVTGIIDGCESGGSIHGNHFVGGIAGQNRGVIRNCRNTAAVNTTPQQNTVELSDITIESITASESSSTTTDIGGIAGVSSGVIRRCTNRADVGYRQMGYNVGGIAGTQSGYIADCENYGNISGRKEVGGIAGQMEPAAKIEYSIDTLQILEQQLDTMSGLTAAATANAQAGAGSIANQLAGLKGQVTNAQEAIEQLIPSVDPENPDDPVDVPDMDSLMAAQSALSGAMSGMQNNLNGIASTAQGMAYTLSRDMKAITNQMDAMSQTINSASEGLGGSITDVSDADTDADISGKIAYSDNFGSIQADMNAGGIAGAMSPENDLDIQDDLDILGEASLNFESELRAVILGCENSGDIRVNKQNGGGVVGLMAMGLVKNAVNVGPVNGEDADYTGGIAGQSRGYIRSCYAKSSVSGSSFVGGIAGSGSTVSDCRAMTQLTGTERLGGLLGSCENRDAVTGNYYAAADKDPGAIDSVSYLSAGQCLDLDAFLALENLPAIFRNITVTFRFEEGSVLRTVPLGKSLDPEDIPELPEKEGYLASWDGLQEDALVFDHTVTAVYTPYETVIAFNFINDLDHPVLLAQGSFPPGTTLSLTELDQQPETQKRQKVLSCYRFTIDGPQAMVLRYQYELPNSGSHQILVRTAGTWKTADFTTDGSYLVFPVDADADAFCLVETAPNYLLSGGIALLILMSLSITLILRKRRHK